MLSRKKLTHQTHASAPSYLCGKIKCNSQEAISLHGHVYGLTKGGFITRAGAVLSFGDCCCSGADT